MTHASIFPDGLPRIEPPENHETDGEKSELDLRLYLECWHAPVSPKPLVLPAPRILRLKMYGCGGVHTFQKPQMKRALVQQRLAPHDCLSSSQWRQCYRSRTVHC